MNKLITIPMVLMLMTAFFAADVLAQKGRGRAQQRYQQNRMQAGNQQGTPKVVQGQNARAGNGNQRTTGFELADAERQSLVFMREEEKLARDVYLAMHENWGARVFSNISRAESQHMTAMANLLERYGIPDPVTNDTPGSFTDVRFQELYETLVATGSSSLVDALKVGLKIEEMDIADLRAAIKTTNNQDIKRVFEQLERGSRNHLRAFAKQLNQTGGTYTAANLSQEDFAQIATGGHERGGEQGQAGGRGKGQGQGNGQGNAQGNDRGNGRGRGRGKKGR